MRHLLAFLVLISAVLFVALPFQPLRGAAEVQPSDDWPTLQHDPQRTGYTARCPKPPYRLRWVWCNGQPLPASKVAGAKNIPVEALPDFVRARFLSIVQPMVKAGVAYLGSVEGDLYAIDVKTGQTKWQSKASGPILHCATVTDQAVYVGTLAGVDAFDLDGKKRWSFVDPHRGGSAVCCS